MARKKNIRRKFTASELSAYSAAYANELSKKDLYIRALVPGIAFFLIATITLYIWWLSLGLFIFGTWYGWRVFVPYIVRKRYEEAAFIERNRFLNSMTQMLINPDKPLLDALVDSKDRARGEFKGDLEVVIAKLFDAGTAEEKKEAFRELQEKHYKDIIFIMYIEQLETIELEGRSGKGITNALKDIKTYHNDVKMRKLEYATDKSNAAHDMKLIIGIVAFMILVINFAFGFERYLYGFAWHPIGYVMGGTFIAGNINRIMKFIEYYYDDDIMEVSL